MPGLLDRIGGLLLKSLPAVLRPRLGGRRASGVLTGGGGWQSWFPWQTDNKVEQVRAFKAWTYVAVDTISTAFSQHLPNVSVIRQPGDKGKRDLFLRGKSRQKAMTPLLAHEELEPVGQSHPLLRLLRDPNEPDTGHDLLYESMLYLLLTGNCYWWVVPNDALNLPAALWCLPAHWVWPRLDESGAVAYYDLRPVESPTPVPARFSIPACDVIHFRKKSPVSKVDGYAPLTAGAQWVDTQQSIDRARWFTFRNGIFPGVSVEFDASVKLPSEDDLDRIEARLLARYGGEQNANRPVLIPPGAKLRKMQLTPQELMFCESADQAADQILALFRVPKVLAQPPVGISQGALLGANSWFHLNTLNPLWRFFGTHLTEKLAFRYGSSLRVWWEDRTPEDPELFERQLNTDLAYGARTMNEVRASRGLEPYPEWWGNVPWIPLNTRPLTSVLDMDANDAAGGSQGSNLGTRSDPGNMPQGGEALDPRS